MNAEHNGPMTVEDDIDATLKMLGETQPPAEIATRVHQRLEAAAMSQRARSGRALLIPVAGIAMTALALVAVSIQMHRTQEGRTFTVETARVATIVPTPQRMAVATKSSQEGKRSVRHFAEGRGRRSREIRHATNLLSYPLTRQEKLLVRFVQTARPADLQALNPEYQAKMEAQQEAEFATYLKSGSDSSTQETAN